MCKFAEGRINSAAGLRAGKFIKARVCSINHDFSDKCIDKNTVSVGRYHYEVAYDDERQGNPTRVGIVIREAVSISSLILVARPLILCFRN